jgi:hypothetical protein
LANILDRLEVCVVGGISLKEGEQGEVGCGNVDGVAFEDPLALSFHVFQEVCDTLLGSEGTDGERLSSKQGELFELVLPRTEVGVGNGFGRRLFDVSSKTNEQYGCRGTAAVKSGIEELEPECYLHLLVSAWLREVETDKIYHHLQRNMNNW